MKIKNSELLKLRDRKLVERFYYWSEIERRRFDDVYRILSHDEFFVSPQTITKVIRKENDYLNELIETKKNKNQMKLF